ncbi:MAG: hypothetical protein MN733_26080 [Nitrososphaera sp.]|nr:hypothetical protein [Nitrososphaera sp.]
MESTESPASRASSEFDKLRPLYHNMVDEVSFALRERLKAKSARIVSISGRVKDSESFREKVTRKSYADPLSEMTDLAGVRVVCNYESDLAEIVAVIESEFDVHDVTDKSLDLGVEKMGYHGRHFIVSFGKRYSGVRYEKISGLKCEIQARTILQDAWAIISHNLVYKEEASIPARLRRDLNNVSSLLEIAQSVFDTVNEKQQAYRVEIAQREPDKAAFLSQPVDFETLLAYSKWKFPGLPVSEQWNDRLAQDINLIAYPTLAQVDAAVVRAAPAVEAYHSENPDWFKTGTDYITKSLGFVDVQFRKRHAFAKRTLDAFRTYEKLVLAK